MVVVGAVVEVVVDELVGDVVDDETDEEVVLDGGTVVLGTVVDEGSEDDVVLDDAVVDGEGSVVDATVVVVLGGAVVVVVGGSVVDDVANRSSRPSRSWRAGPSGRAAVVEGCRVARTRSSMAPGAGTVLGADSDRVPAPEATFTTSAGLRTISTAATPPMARAKARATNVPRRPRSPATLGPVSPVAGSGPGPTPRAPEVPLDDPEGVEAEVPAGVSRPILSSWPTGATWAAMRASIRSSRIVGSGRGAGTARRSTPPGRSARSAAGPSASNNTERVTPPTAGAADGRIDPTSSAS